MVSLFDGYKADNSLWKPSHMAGDNLSNTLNLFGNTESLIIKSIEDSNSGLPNKIRDEAQKVLDRTNTSITNFISKMIITARVYIQRSIADDPSIDDNLASIQNQYLGFILAALGLSDTIIGGRTVKELINVVSTESFDTLDNLALETFGPVTMAKNKNDKNDANDNGDLKHARDLEKIREKDRLDRNRDNIKYDRDIERDLEQSERDKERDINKHEQDLKRDNIKHSRDVDRDNTKYEQDKERDKRNDRREANVNRDTRELSLSSGRIIEFTFEGPQGKRKISIPVHLIPRVIPDEVAEQFVSLNFSLDIKRRWLQVLSGEKSFFRDLLFNLDLRKKKADAMKKDTTGVLYDMLEKTNSQAGKHIVDKLFFFEDPAKSSQNLANAVLIYDKASFMQYANSVGIKWDKMSVRENFFTKTMSFMVVLIDPIYDVSEYYWSGFDFKGEYSSKQLKAAKAKGSYDLKDIMTAFNQGVNPKF